MNKAAFDPGFSGAFAVECGDKIIAKKFPIIQIDKRKLLDCGVVSDWLIDHFVDEVFLERVQSNPHDGKASAFSFGCGWGQLIGTLQTLKIRWQFVPPPKWKRHHGLIGKDKKASIFRCKQLFPSVNLCPKPCRVDQDGLAEAVLILDYGRKVL